MNEIKVLISFEKRINRIIGVDLTSGDYNSTKMIFDFDRQDGAKVFELKNPKGELVFAKEIENNEIILARVNEDGTYSSLFDMPGDYIFEVSLYTEDSKLTSEYEILPVEPEQVVFGDEVVEPYLPVFDELIQKINKAINETNNLDIDVTTVDETTRVEITKKDGTKKSAIVSGGTGTITGVKVDGNSVVKGGVADINFKTINNQTIVGEGNITIEVENGVDGVDGKSVYDIWLEQGNAGTEQDFLNTLKGQDGTNGVDGQDGYSPTAKVETTSTGATITITDKNGTTITTITNGKDGTNGIDGKDYVLTETDKEDISKLVEVNVPTKVSQLENDKNYLTSVPSDYKTKTENDSLYQSKGNYLTSYTETDPTVPSHVKSITANDISNWNGKSTFSGNYNDLSNKPTIPTKTSQLTNDSGYLTEHQDLSGYARTTEIPTKVSELENDKNYLTEIELTQEQLDEIIDTVVEAQKIEFVESTDECKDTSKQYVLPDGYIYTYTEKTVSVKHELNDGTGLINVRPVTNSTMDKTQDASGVWTSPILEINPSEVGPTSNRRNETLVVISGLEKLVPAFNSSSVWVWFYDASGNKLYVLKGSQFSELTDGEITLPTSFALRTPDMFNDTNWATIKYIRIVLGISTSGNITANDVSNLSVNIPFFDYETLKYGWYSTGHMYNKDEYTEAIEQNASNIKTLQSDVETLKKAVQTTPSQSGAVWYAVGDSITKGYGVGADKCWVKYVLDYNGYDKEKSKNLGISGLGFAKSDPNYHKTARTVVDENDFSNVDLVTIAIGINDWKEPFSIDTVKSEMGYCFEKILTDNPYCKIIFIVPFNIWLKGSASTNWALGYSGSDVTGGTLQNFIDAQKSVCEEYGIQIIDMTNNSVINKVNIETVLYDKVHPNAECHIALGRELARRITYV